MMTYDYQRFLVVMLGSFPFNLIYNKNISNKYLSNARLCRGQNKPAWIIAC